MIVRFCYAVYLQLLNQHNQEFPTLVTRPFFARSKGGVWERDYGETSVCAGHGKIARGVAATYYIIVGQHCVCAILHEKTGPAMA